MLYITDRAGSGVGSIYEHRADGTGNATLVLHSAMDWGQVVPSRDGRWLVLRNAPSGSTPNAVFGLRRGDTAVAPLDTVGGTNDVTQLLTSHARPAGGDSRSG